MATFAIPAHAGEILWHTCGVYEPVGAGRVYAGLSVQRLGEIHKILVWSLTIQQQTRPGAGAGIELSWPSAAAPSKAVAASAAVAVAEAPPGQTWLLVRVGSALSQTSFHGAAEKRKQWPGERGASGSVRLTGPGLQSGIDAGYPLEVMLRDARGATIQQWSFPLDDWTQARDQAVEAAKAADFKASDYKKRCTPVDIEE